MLNELVEHELKSYRFFVLLSSLFYFFSFFFASHLPNIIRVSLHTSFSFQFHSQFFAIINIIFFRRTKRRKKKKAHYTKFCSYIQAVCLSVCLFLVALSWAYINKYMFSYILEFNDKQQSLIYFRAKKKINKNLFLFYLSFSC